MLIGVRSIDEAHEELIGQLDLLMSDADALVDSVHFSEIFSQLGLAITEHFRDEEAVFKALPMPTDLVAGHIQAHNDILRQYTQINLDLMDGIRPGRADVLAMIRAWILDHLLEHDLVIRDYLTEAAAVHDRIAEPR